jgi:CHAT domain-containing protein
MAFIYALCAMLVAAGQQPGTAAWYQKKADDAIAKAQRSNKADAMRLIEEMRKVAEGQAAQDWKLWIEWKKGLCEYYLGDLSQSIATLEKIEPVKNFPLRHEVVRDLGDAHLESGNPAKAEGYLKAAAAMPQKFEPTERASINLKLIQCRIGLTRMEDARKELAIERKSLDIMKANANPEQWACLDARWNLLQAGMDVDGRNPLRALVRLDATQKSLMRFPLSAEPLDLRFKCHIGLAADYWLVARFADADAQLDMAERIVSSVMTERNLASLKNARAALLIEKAALEVDNEYQAEQMLANLDKAKSNLDAALGHLKKISSAPDSLTSTIDFQLCQVHELRGRMLEAHGNAKDGRAELEKAKERCDITLKWRTGVYKADHDLVLETRTRLAWINLRLGNAKRAQEESAEALKLFDGGHKKNDLDRGRYLHILFEAENQLGNTVAAAQYAHEHRRLVDDGLGTLVAGLSASEQIQFFRKWDTQALNACLRIGLQHADDQELAAASAEWLVNGKTKLAEVLATQVQAARHADRAAFANFQKSVQRQAFLMYGEPATDFESLQREFLFEESTKRMISERAAKQFRPKQNWYALADVRGHLREDELYVGIYCLRLRDGARRVYHAWLFGKRGPVQTVELGDAKTIEDLVKLFVREQERAPLIAPGEEKQAEQYLHKLCLEELSRRILHPILKLSNGKKRWIISPDGPLWNIPWAALLLPDNQYALEELTFRYALSGQDLAPAPAASAEGEPLVLGDPWFNYPDTDRQRLRKPGVDPLRLPWDRLEYSRRECEMVLAIMEDSKLAPNRALGLVQKSQLLGLPRAPRIVYLSTHAFGVLPSRMNVDDPLLSCGLAFAGWNYLPLATDSSLPGMMTGAEVLGIDLRGTELVVLASCAAGRDELAYGQSPANLRHAFHLAGARAVVSALWAINDKATLEVMEPFMESICQPNADKAAALREAQRQSIRYLRMYRDHAHPFYWAGFTISGT